MHMKYTILALFVTLLSQNTSAQNMDDKSYQIEGMTIAITNMERMLEFYSKVFDIDFSEKEMYNSKLYSGHWGGLDLLFCPAEIAGNTAIQNRHQFDIIVSDLEAIIEVATKYGGKTMGGIVENEDIRNVGIYDPDKNSILFKQLKK